MCLRYSSSVVAPIARSSPRASIGFSRLAASTAPSAAPAPTIVCSSSMNRMIRPSAALISASTAFSRSSNSPRYLAPASSAPTSSAHTRRSLQALRHVAGGDPLGQALDDGGLADAGLADQHRVVLGAPGEHLDHAAHLLVAADHRVELAPLGQLGQVAAELGQRLVGALGVGRGDALRPPRTSTSAFDAARPRSRLGRCGASASSRCSTATYSSFSASASENARSSTLRVGALAAGCCWRALDARQRRRRRRRCGRAARRVGAGLLQDAARPRCRPGRAARAAGAPGSARDFRARPPCPARRRRPPET